MGLVVLLAVGQCGAVTSDWVLRIMGASSQGPIKVSLNSLQVRGGRQVAFLSPMLIKSSI